MSVVNKDRSAITKANKERKAKTITNRLAKRKSWRIKKHGATPLSELFRTTLNLFQRWGHRRDEAIATIKLKKFRRPRKAVGNA